MALLFLSCEPTTTTTFWVCLAPSFLGRCGFHLHLLIGVGAFRYWMSGGCFGGVW